MAKPAKKAEMDRACLARPDKEQPPCNQAVFADHLGRDHVVDGGMERIVVGGLSNEAQTGAVGKTGATGSFGKSGFVDAKKSGDAGRAVKALPEFGKNFDGRVIPFDVPVFRERKCERTIKKIIVLACDLYRNVRGGGVIAKAASAARPRSGLRSPRRCALRRTAASGRPISFDMNGASVLVG
ncbi:hypothetical protein K2X14_14145 [Acetobacter sp. TBRC 12305]|uniref:Uncharacterized protein n=1 Tax=Acetobacter garciniae TaxID=2817435 RepID=A0A939HPI9_9PROT|nr:hypothetical protein [Acetobacter garciniae]MBO1326286.1 hypothetical protein [Acetobacter garciniae]MBX0345975.1 hypothetical protein [Acetobacter garciniae]